MFFALLIIVGVTVETTTVWNCLSVSDESKPSDLTVAGIVVPTEELIVDADQIVAAAFDHARGPDKFKALAKKRYDVWVKAEDEDPNAMFLLGMCQFAGVGAPRDGKNALNLFHRSADQGSVHAQVMMGRFAEMKGSPDALKYYSKAADKNFALAEYRLGVVYSEGKIAPMDLERAFRLILTAAEHGLAAAQADVGSRFENGVGTNKDLKKAFEWYKKSAAQDDAIGHLNVGLCWLKGIGTTVDSAKAELHLEAAVRLGDELVRKMAGQYLKK